MRTIRVVADKEAVSRTAAEEFVRLAKEANAARGRFVVALSGGSTPRRLYQLLADAPFRGQVDWPTVQLFWGDERSVPPDHPDSNYRMTREAMLDKLGLAAGQVHRLLAERPDRDAAAQEYQNEIAQVFGVPADGPPPAFDLALLGMGPDGHTASLFPHTEALKETRRWVAPNFVPKFDTWRMTFTRPMLNRAANVLFLVAGEDKTDRVVQVLEGPADPDGLPSQSIDGASTVWLLDRAAAAKLKQ